MRLSALLPALLVLAAGCAEPDAPTVAQDDTGVVATSDTLSGVASDTDGEGMPAPEAVSAVEAGEELGGVGAAAAGEDAGPVESRRAGEGRAATVTRAVRVEGDASPETLRLAAFPDFPVPFSTYLRPGVRTEQPGSGDAVSFEVGEEPYAARVLVTVPNESVDAAVARIRGAVSGAQPLEGQRAWVRDGFSVTQGDIVTAVRIEQHDGTTFVVEETMPAEMGDGFSPTVQILLDAWRWADGSAL